MGRQVRQPRAWQLRLTAKEDGEAERLAKQRMISKNDVVRHALHLLLRLELETTTGGRVLLERAGGTREAVEVWVVW